MKKEKISYIPNKEIKANIFSRLTFSWFGSLAKTGYKRPLIQNDLFELRPQDFCSKITGELEPNWNEEKKQTKPKLINSLKKQFKKPFLLGGVPKFFGDVCSILNPILLQQLIKYMSDSSASQSTGIILVIFLFLSGIIRSFSENLFLDQVIKVGFRARSGLISLIYRKSLLINRKISDQQQKKQEPKKEEQELEKKEEQELEKKEEELKKEKEEELKEKEKELKKEKEKKLTKKERKALAEKQNEEQIKSNLSSTGQIVNLMSSDVTKVQEITFAFHFLWSAPVQVIVCLGLLINLLGASSLVGFGILVLSFPINGVIFKKFTKKNILLMMQSDSRIKIINELLQGIRVIKFYAWEKIFKKKILDLRDKEISILKSILILRMFLMVIFTILPLLTALATFVVYGSTGNKLTAEKVFTSIALFELMRVQLLFLPWGMVALANFKVSMKRIETFLLSPEIPEENVEIHRQRVDENSNEVQITIQNGSFTYDTNNNHNNNNNNEIDIKKEIPLEEQKSQKQVLLKNISLDFEPRKLTMIIGPVGSGKSSLLAAILGEMVQLQGKTTIKGSIAYASQEAWIRNGSVKENILFGHALDKKRYNQVIESCALIPDLAVLPAGDSTEIGEKGVNISGGQKQRISLARAIYSNADVFLFDDPLSAVDAHVGRHIFDQAILGKVLQAKTRILVTHQLQYLPHSDFIVVIKDGEVFAKGTFEELIHKGVDFSNLLGDQEKRIKIKEKEKEKIKWIDLQPETESDIGDNFEVGTDIELPPNENTEKEISKQKNENKKAELVKEEEREFGAVASFYYKRYIKVAGGCCFLFIVIISAIFRESLRAAADYWLAIWTDGTIFHDKKDKFYIGIYVAISCGMFLFAFVFSGVWVFASIRASRTLHHDLLYSITRAPTRFFDTTPIGRILNRFSKDMLDIDLIVGGDFENFISTSIALLAVLLVIASVAPYFLIPLVVISYIYYKFMQYYRSTSREIQRLESISRSPVYNNFSETLTGLSTIRAFQKQKEFIEINDTRVDASTNAIYCNFGANRWFGIRVETISSIVVLFISIIIVMQKDSMNSSFAALALTYSLQVTILLTWIVRYGAMLEQHMNSVERCVEFSSVESEKPEIIPHHRPPKNWPNLGKIQFDKICMRYREGLPSVLKKVSATIQPQEKVGIVGRTGSGKSSLMLSLFRIVEIYRGKIEIDGIDISQIGLKDLRDKLAIIPQDVVMFTGTVRENLDPSSEYNDEKIWEILEHVHLYEKIDGLEQKLETKVTEGGDNFSAGEKQLICLARALLKHPKILVLDEATSSIDTETDSLIQKTIREQFKDCTVLTIAHRLHTIMDSDRIMCLENGKIKEFDKPSLLLRNPNGLLSQLVHRTGPKTEAHLKKIANGEESIL
ncbi:abc transporter atp-binding protein/permease vmr1-related [Anaeramoeba ignava]|uniref:Abc transporter atp-binding protein/permease vmr1-related n=1 Tax=Anaeramoeba ignava TaxID=1746090 RepID=A0A9Q0LDD9_ANAIG|nr:abc transporter atp-binding protein/permease vmr1-related [Anaeramoeba ignava]